MTFQTMAEVKKANKAAGQFWFSPNTLRFFDSRIESELLGGEFFVTSEHRPGDRRKFSVRRVTPDAHIENVGEFYAYATLAAALKAINALLMERAGASDGT